jgi:hypothetical protein
MYWAITAAALRRRRGASPDRLVFSAWVSILIRFLVTIRCTIDTVQQQMYEDRRTINEHVDSNHRLDGPLD